MNKEMILKNIKEKEQMVKQLQEEITNLKLELANASVTINNSISTNEKIEILSNYFKGRDDLYSVLQIDSKDNTKKYYVPVCANEWKSGICNKTMHKKCKDCKYKEYVPLTKNEYKRHLEGKIVMGIYPLLDDDTCYFLVLDFDDKLSKSNIKEELKSFRKTCNKYNVPIAIERSRSGLGYHAWIFFSEKVKAARARKLGSLLLSKSMESIDTLKIDSFDRMFPNQDYLPKNGYGNLIALPFQIKPAMLGNTLFVDDDFLPYKNQWEYLNSLCKLSNEDLEYLIKEISNYTIDLGDENINIKDEIKVKDKVIADYPKYINVILEDMVYIAKDNLSASARNAFRKLATFANPEFYKKQRMRLPVYNIPMVIDCSSNDDKFLRLPRGTYEYLESLCELNNIKINIEDKRKYGEKIKIKFNGNLYKEQSVALNELLKYNNGILHAPTGFGKTVIACKLIEKQSVNTLIIVHNLNLLNQWQERIKKFLDFDAGQIGGGKNNLTNIIDVASIKTLWNNGSVNDVIKNYGMVIIDECHHLGAYTYEQAVNKVSSKYVYGISATPNREDGHSPIVKMQCGDIRYEVDYKRFNKNLGIPMKIIVRDAYLNFVDPLIKDYTLNEIKNLIVKNIDRSEKIISNVKKEYESGKNILVLTERIEHLNYLYNRFKKITNNVFLYKGGMGKKTLKKYSEENENIISSNENKIIVAIGSYIGEGFDDATLDVLFLTMPISGLTKVIQYSGRLHRYNPNKKEILIYDYVDKNFKQTRNMFEKRRKTYKKLGYEIIDTREIG